MNIVKLKRGKEKKILNNYPWVFKDEIADIIKDENTYLCNLFSFEDKFLGKALVNEKSNKYLYMLTKKDEKIDYEFFKSRIEKALHMRDKIYNVPYYRLVNSESDFLPGLIVDRFGDYFSIQIRLKALEKFKNDIVNILKEFFAPKGIFERSDFETLKNEELLRNHGVLYGNIPDKIEIVENDIKYFVDIKNGQKTGFFFDQRDSRKYLKEIINGKKKGLDLYTYTGSFALIMAKAGLETDAVDKSEYDIQIAKQNALLNNVKINFVVSDAIEYIKNSEKNYDVIILDPPSLIKNKSQIKWSKNILKDLVRHSLNHMNDKGILSFCSCAYYLNWDVMTEILRMASGDLGIYLRVLNQTFQGKDHPWILQIPESLYLKCFWLEVNK